jgi:hypothetical protein
LNIQLQLETLTKRDGHTPGKTVRKNFDKMRQMVLDAPKKSSAAKKIYCTPDPWPGPGRFGIKVAFITANRRA